ncbi:phosphatidate cytidylyltransferase [Octadecabacter sp. 1_MG-2023]|uniref:phosphatidate cytidylyltransferase n=1 Tax=unclassified Octadecabacter TaxID=196158 RepID=UPI001C0872C0|nr:MULTISPECIES: phosphatidate cytidylyltransferase [unclassified Octadecabacter]MBU2993207.1 phosphatidate cytidylyltransferase [Octadecabacter sp. B2R22]MDO6733340.1 phosphatidate cytidylyltransferase [Octadecabacter sp. 1_MG-2023]
MAANWEDLKPRLLSSVWMAAIGIGAIIMGGVWFQMLAVFVTAVMVWECWIMIRGASPTSGMLLAAAVASILSAQVFGGSQAPEFLVLFLVVPVLGALVLNRERITFFVFALALQIAGWGLVHFRIDYGFTWLIWLVGIVVMTDVAGYFAGKSLGGPKFWPAISPKKTWSGTIGGWIGAALVGFVFTLFTNAGLSIILLSVVISFAGQMGDIAESALKRRQGVKDSSTLIPGHGGLFDRFDALLGASLFMLLVASIFNVPGVAF